MHTRSKRILALTQLFGFLILSRVQLLPNRKTRLRRGSVIIGKGW
ncbi:hypothetical protein CPL00187_CDS0215 [Escherichia phage GoldenSnicker]